jgi:sterol desaturase/sphingolipid hydroxylase (fatty acid hydroxylase superfamily)
MVHLSAYWGTAIATAVHFERHIPIECVTVVLLNQLVYSILPVLVVGSIYTPSDSLIVTAPSWINGFHQWLTRDGWRIFYKVPSAVLVIDMFYYPIHRLFHYSPYMYRTVHRQHHRWKTSLGASAFYASSFEHCVANIFPPLMAAAVCALDDMTLTIWMALTSISTVLVHARNGPHTIHHENKRMNFGVGFQLLDKLCNTYSRYGG